METCRNKVPLIKVHLKYECIFSACFHGILDNTISNRGFMIIQTKDAPRSAINVSYIL